MNDDDPTIPEARRRALVLASFRDDGATRALVNNALVDNDARQRVLALRAASRHGWLDPQQWIRALDDDDATVRAESAALLVTHETLDERVAERLIRALHDNDSLVVDAAAFALGEFEVASALSALIDTARHHDDARCRESAVAALGTIGDVAAVDTVIDALQDKAPIRRRAVVALANFEGPRVEEALRLASDDRDWQVRAAVDQLGVAESRES